MTREVFLEVVNILSKENEGGELQLYSKLPIGKEEIGIPGLVLLALNTRNVEAMKFLLAEKVDVSRILEKNDRTLWGDYDFMFAIGFITKEEYDEFKKHEKRRNASTMNEEEFINTFSLIDESDYSGKLDFIRLSLKNPNIKDGWFCETFNEIKEEVLENSEYNGLCYDILESQRYEFYDFVYTFLKENKVLTKDSHSVKNAFANKDVENFKRLLSDGFLCDSEIYYKCFNFSTYDDFNGKKEFRNILMEKKIRYDWIYRNYLFPSNKLKLDDEVIKAYRYVVSGLKKTRFYDNVELMRKTFGTKLFDVLVEYGADVYSDDGELFSKGLIKESTKKTKKLEKLFSIEEFKERCNFDIDIFKEFFEHSSSKIFTQIFIEYFEQIEHFNLPVTIDCQEKLDVGMALEKLSAESLIKYYTVLSSGWYECLAKIE